MESRVNEHGQITIDREARRRLGIEPGMIEVQRIVDGHLGVAFLRAPRGKSLFGILHDPDAPPGPVTGEQIEEAVAEALAEKHAKLEGEHG